MHEAGGHRWQRISPTEKRGRTHTSTITVAVLPVPREQELMIDPKDLDWKTCRSSGPGGQHGDRTDSAVQLTHKPTGLSVRIENEKSQHRNKTEALNVLRARLLEKQKYEVNTKRASDRKKQVGSGMRGDKRRTIRTQDGIVKDHVLGKKWRLKDYLRGNWSY